MKCDRCGASMRKVSSNPDSELWQCNNPKCSNSKIVWKKKKK